MTKDAEIEALEEELSAGRQFVPANHPLAKIEAVLALIDERDRWRREYLHASRDAAQGLSLASAPNPGLVT